MWTREGQNMFELRISDSSSSIIFDQCKHRYSRSGCSQMSTNKNLYWTVLLAKILTTCKISLSFLILLSAIFFTAIVQSLVEFQKDHSTRPFNNWMIQTISSLFAGIILSWIIFNFWFVSFRSSLFVQLNIFEQMKKNGKMRSGMDPWGD